MIEASPHAYSNLNSHTERAHRLRKVGNQINACLDLQTILKMTYHAVREIGGFDRVGLFLYSPVARCMARVMRTNSSGETVSDPYCWAFDAEAPALALVLDGAKPYRLYRHYGARCVPRSSMASVQDRVAIYLRARGQLLGMISADNLFTGRPIREADVELLLPFCEEAATSIHTVRLLAERDRARQEAELRAEKEALINRISRAVGSTLDPDEVIPRVIEELRQIGDYWRISLLRPDESMTEWQIVAAWDRLGEGGVAPVGTWLRLPPGNAPVRRPDSPLHYRPDVANDNEWMSRELAAAKVASMLTVELWLQERCLGAINLSYTHKDGFSARECALMEALAPALALALHNADLYRSLKLAQEAVVRSETLRAVSELAGGVAHNINNLLAAILGYAELILAEPDDLEAIQHDARVIQQAAMDGAQIVHRLQRFAQPQPPPAHAAEPILLSLDELLTTALKFTRPRWERSGGAAAIRVRRMGTPGLQVCGNATALREVLINLIHNACDAMPDGGTLTLHTRLREQGVTIECRDTGTGMEPETCKRVFEPFFTTKGVERGLGLGLSVSWGLVQQHNGSMDVESKKGRGTIFRVTLPNGAA